MLRGQREYQQRNNRSEAQHVLQGLHSRHRAHMLAGQLPCRRCDTTCDSRARCRAGRDAVTAESDRHHRHRVPSPHLLFRPRPHQRYHQCPSQGVEEHAMGMNHPPAYHHRTRPRYRVQYRIRHFVPECAAQSPGTGRCARKMGRQCASGASNPHRRARFPATSLPCTDSTASPSFSCTDHGTPAPPSAATGTTRANASALRPR